jgi:hypothetical protein
MTTETIIAITALTTALAGLAVPLAKLWSALAPFLRRRGMPVVVVAGTTSDKDAAAFVASLRTAGYRTVERTRIASAVPASARAVVLWEPAPDLAGELIGDVRDASPDAEVLVFSTSRLPIAPGAALISNSALRLRGDLADVAEALGA